MRVLIDTHIAIWAVLNDPKLPKQAKDIFKRYSFIDIDMLISAGSNKKGRLRETGFLLSALSVMKP